VDIEAVETRDLLNENISIGSKGSPERIHWTFYNNTIKTIFIEGEVT